jgi:quercetin dioxygenase-like cupin family protein
MFLPVYECISEAHDPGVMEIVSVITGQLDILSDGHWHNLKQGQSIRFAGDRTHGYRNPAKTKAIVHTLIHYPHRS